jgi:hypothetical protein
LQVLVNRSTMFKTEMHKIQKNASHVLTVRTYRERTKPKDVMRLTRLGKFRAHATLKLIFLLRVREILQLNYKVNGGKKEDWNVQLKYQCHTKL